MSTLLAAARVSELMARRPAFLSFLRRKVGDLDRAEELLQDVTVRSLPRLGQLPGEVALVPWFFKVLENAVYDDARRRSARQRAVSRMVHEMPEGEAPKERTERTCPCVHRARVQLKPHYAVAIQRVIFDGLNVKRFAEEEGISENNGAVRLHRARAALKAALEGTCGACASAGCTDCTC